MKKILHISLFAAAALTASMGRSADADENAALASALGAAKISLEQGLKASASVGRPISGKFEIEHGALQLSVYTAKDDKFSEVIVDHQSGAIKQTETITDAQDLTRAGQQSAAMAHARASLSEAVARAVKTNSSYRAVSAIAEVEAGRAKVDITLMQGGQVKHVSELLQ